MKDPASLLRKAVFALSLGLVVVAGFLGWYEHSGRLERRVQRMLREALGEEVWVERVDLDWFAPSATLRGVRYAGERPAVAIDEVDVELAWRNGALCVDRVDVLGGHLELSEELVERLQTARAGQAPRNAVAPPPLVVVRDVTLAWRHPELGRFAIGTLDAVYRAGSGGSPEVRGRILPAFAAPATSSASEIHFGGWRDAAGRIGIRASCSGVPVTAEALPQQSPLGALRDWKWRAELSFDLEASFVPEAGASPAGKLRASLAHGKLEPPTTAMPITDVDLELDASCAADAPGELLDPRKWHNTAKLSASWNGSPIEAWALVGANAGPDCSARVWARAPSLRVSRDALEAAGLAERLASSWNALDPRGEVDLLCGLCWPPAASVADQGLVSSAQVSLDLDLRGTSGVTVHGWPRKSDQHREGFPLPIDTLTGRVVALHDPRGEQHPTLLALLEVLGSHSGGTREEQPAFIEGLVISPRSSGRPSFDLRIGGHGIPIDDHLREAFAGLDGTAFIWKDFGPSGGSASALVRLYYDEPLDHPAARVTVELFDADARWSDIPVPLADLHGRVEFIGDPRALLGAGFDLRCRTPLGARLSVVGRAQDDPGRPPDRHAPAHRPIESISIGIEDLFLKGSDRDAIVAALPEIGHALDPYRPQGRIDLTYRDEREHPAGARHWRVEVTPKEVVLTPSEFPVPTSAVRGRVLVEGVRPPPDSSERPSTRTRIVPLAGTWVQGASIAALADLPSDGEGVVDVHAAGVDLSNSSLVGAFRASQSQGLTGGHSGLGLSALDIDGRVDFVGEFTIPARLPRAPQSNYRVYLRDNDVKTNVAGNRFALGNLVGILEQKGGVLLGEEVTATLAGTPIVLRRAHFEEKDDLYRVETSIHALGIEIDREHLRPFLSDKIMQALVDELGWRGKIDLLDTTLTLTGSPQTGGEARFSGYVTPREMSIDFGVPLSVDMAAVHVEELVYSREAVRASAAVEKLDGRVADHDLLDASFRLEYVDPRLSIEGLEGELEGGRISGLAEAEHEEPAFAIDLASPFRFQLAAGVEQLDVGELLKGMFESDFASRGRLTGRLRLEGDLKRLTGIHGRGRVSMRNTTLWSIPVVRDVLSQFGLDSTAVFESIESELEIDRGRIAMKKIELSSPLLKLVGKGTLDFDGTLHQDLDVRYALLDNLGWLNRLIYWIQHSLASVAVRGDMERPRVELKGMLGGLRSEKERGRDLPLPALAPLPARF